MINTLRVDRILTGNFQFSDSHVENHDKHVEDQSCSDMNSVQRWQRKALSKNLNETKTKASSKCQRWTKRMN